MLLLIFSFFCCECSHLSEKEKIVSIWYQKKIIFPNDYVFLFRGDTVDYNLSAKYKVFVYVDSLDCIDCRLKLGQWENFMASIDTSIVKFIMIIDNDDVNSIVSKTKYDKFDYPICIDVKSNFNKLNRFPKQLEFKTFLLDSLNRVIVVGNPLFNERVANLYKKTIK